MTGLDDVKLHLVDSIDDVLALHTWLGERRPHHILAFDTETTGLVVGDDIVRLVQVGDGEHGWALPWSNEVGAQVGFVGGWAGLFADLVRRWDGRWVAHNAKFDVGMLNYMRVRMPRDRVDDTRIMSHCLAPHLSTALKNVAGRLIDPHARDLQDALRDTKWTWSTVPLDYRPYWTYGALDPILTYRIYEELWPRVSRECPDAYELELDVTWVVERMERYGAHIDVAYAKQKFLEFTGYVDSAERWCVKTYGVKPGSNADVVRVLQRDGVTFSKATASGAVALDKDVLGNVDHPLARTVLRRRQLQKLASTYLRHFIEDVDEEDCIHPNVNVLGARTSRMSMERPNLQNLPRRSESNPAADSIRSCVSAREGNVMLMCDFDQIEMRMLASLANERAMIEAFQSSDDFFVTLARLVYDDDTIVKSDPRRQVVKNAGYATIYGAGVEKFAQTAGIELDQARHVRHLWDQNFPDVVKFQRRVIDVATRRRHNDGVSYVRCPITQRFQVADPGKEYALVNFLIQGAAAAVLKKKVVMLDAAGLGQYLVALVHDEVVLDLPRDEVSDAADTLRAVMNDRELFEVPLTASLSHGTTWGSKETYV